MAATIDRSTPLAPSDDTSLGKICSLLTSKDDTSRFVGLALLKSVLDNCPDLRSDPAAILAVWKSISSKFLHRLLRSGCRKGDDGKNMLDLAVSVIHTFVLLLPDHEKQEEKMVGRIGSLVEALVPSTGKTTTLILEALLTLVCRRPGALKFDQLVDLSPLTNIAPTHPRALDVLFYAWLIVMPSKLPSTGHPGVDGSFSNKISATILSLAKSFAGTDAVTLLEFTAHLLRNLDERLLPHSQTGTVPPWFNDLTAFIHNIITWRPNPASRSAYTILIASLIRSYPQATKLIFTPPENTSRGSRTKPTSEKPLSYLLLNLLTIDIRSTMPTLLTKLNRPEYPLDALRISSALEILPAWMSTVLGPIDASDDQDITENPLPMPADLLLKLRTNITETLSLCTDYIRDRWDASVSGVAGLDRAYRPKEAELPTGETRMTLTWDSRHVSADGDPVILSALRAVAVWVLEEEDETPLRAELVGLVDVMVDLYEESATTSTLSLPRHPKRNNEKDETEAAGGGDGAESDGEEHNEHTTAMRSAAREIRGRTLDFIPSILTAFEALARDTQSAAQLHRHGVVPLLQSDLLAILDYTAEATMTRCSHSPSNPPPSQQQQQQIEKDHGEIVKAQLLRGEQVSATLSYLVAEYASQGDWVPLQWLDFLTRFAAWTGVGKDVANLSATRTCTTVVHGGSLSGGGSRQREISLLVLDRVIDAISIAAALLQNTAPATRNKYVHTVSAVVGIGSWVAGQLVGCGGADGRGKEGRDVACMVREVGESMRVLETLS